MTFLLPGIVIIPTLSAQSVQVLWCFGAFLAVMAFLNWRIK